MSVKGPDGKWHGSPSYLGDSDPNNWPKWFRDKMQRSKQPKVKVDPWRFSRATKSAQLAEVSKRQMAKR